MPRPSKRALLGIVLASSLLAAAVEAAPCVKTSEGWTSTTRFRPYMDTPTIPCLLGHPVVQIDSSAVNGAYTAGPVRVLRCGVSSEEFTYSGGHNSFHKFGTLSNWENVLWGACSDLVYSAQ